jgi:basic membrane protein A
VKKILSLILTCVMLISCVSVFVSCGNDDSSDTSDIKVGFIFLHDENSTYDNNFLQAAKAACDELGVKYELKTNIDESSACYEAAADLVDLGCNVIFADSFGHEAYLIQAAKEFPNVQFCHATGTRAHTENLSNFHNAFASIYEGRYLAGVAAGLKLNEMIEAGTITAEQAVIGYVGAYTYAEVISGYTSFFLGARSVCSSATMKVQFTGSWYDVTEEKTAAEALIAAGCVLISQHADSMGAPSACENANVINVSYNGSTIDSCPNTFLISSKVDWTPYFKHMIECVKNGTDLEYDWTGSISTGSVVLSDINTAVAAAGTAEKLEEVKAELVAGTRHVFDTSTFTVNGETLTSYKADVDYDEAYTADTEAISNGYFHESEYRSAPYFDLQIDGIELLNSKY